MQQNITNFHTNVVLVEAATSSGLSRPLTAVPLTLSRMSPGKMSPDICSDVKASYLWKKRAETHSTRLYLHLVYCSSRFSLLEIQRAESRHTSRSSHGHKHNLSSIPTDTDTQAATRPKINLRKSTLLQPSDNPIFSKRVALECEPQTRGRSST